jgi:hypothetical protein
VLIEDFRLPELADRRPASLRPLQWYMQRVHHATQRSAAVTDQFYRVISFLDPPAALFSPRIMANVLLGVMRMRTAAESSVDQRQPLKSWLRDPVLRKRMAVSGQSQRRSTNRPQYDVDLPFGIGHGRAKRRRPRDRGHGTAADP